MLPLWSQGSLHCQNILGSRTGQVVEIDPNIYSPRVFVLHALFGHSFECILCDQRFEWLIFYTPFLNPKLYAIIVGFCYLTLSFMDHGNVVKITIVLIDLSSTYIKHWYNV